MQFSASSNTIKGIGLKLEYLFKQMRNTFNIDDWTYEAFYPSSTTLYTLTIFVSYTYQKSLWR